MPSDVNWGLLEYQALLDVFEKDCGRPAATLAEIVIGRALRIASTWNIGSNAAYSNYFLVPISTCNREVAPVSLRRHAAGACCVASPDVPRP